MFQLPRTLDQVELLRTQMFAFFEMIFESSASEAVEEVLNTVYPGLLPGRDVGHRVASFAALGAERWPSGTVIGREGTQARFSFSVWTGDTWHSEARTVTKGHQMC